jgi:hypothetical protein
MIIQTKQLIEFKHIDTANSIIDEDANRKRSVKGNTAVKSAVARYEEFHHFFKRAEICQSSCQDSWSSLSLPTRTII